MDIKIIYVSLVQLLFALSSDGCELKEYIVAVKDHELSCAEKYLLNHLYQVDLPIPRYTHCLKKCSSEPMCFTAAFDNNVCTIGFYNRTEESPLRAPRNLFIFRHRTKDAPLLRSHCNNRGLRSFNTNDCSPQGACQCEGLFYGVFCQIACHFSTSTKCIFGSGYPSNFPIQLTWCKSLGGTIFEVRNAEEHAIAAILNQVFLGAVKRNNEYHYLSDNSSLQYSNWADGEPSTMVEGCVRMWWGVYYDIGCEASLTPVCEKPILPP